VTPGRRALVLALVLAFAGVCAWWPVLRNDFVDWDDGEYVTNNQLVQGGLTWSGMTRAMTTFQAANWHPLTWMSHMADYSLFGLEPWGHHLVGLLLHLANALLLFALLRWATGRSVLPAVAAAFFMLHPLRVESVAWASERKDLLAGFFWMLTLLAYRAYLKRPSWPRYASVAACLGLGLMAKPMLVTLPMVLLLLDFWPMGRLAAPSAARVNRAARVVAEKLPLLALSVASSALTYLAQSRGGSVNMTGRQHLVMRIPNAVMSYARYLQKSAWPEGLAIFYPLPTKPPGLPITLAIGAGLLAVTLVSIRWWRRRPYLAVGWFWYLGTLVPVIGLIQVGGQAYADRYTYLPLIGVVMALGWLAADLGRRVPVTAVAGVVGILLAVMGGLTMRQIGVWRDTESLFRHTLAVTENNWMAHSNYGVIMDDKGRLKEAEVHFREAVRILPDPNLLSNLGNLLDKTGRAEEAAYYLRQAIDSDAANVPARYNMANILLRGGDVARSIDLYNEVLRLNPGHSNAHNNLAIALVNQGRTAEAEFHYRESFRLDPKNVEAMNNLGAMLLGRGQLVDAEALFRQAIAVRPGYATAYSNLGDTLYSQGRRDEAMASYRELLRLRPSDAKARAILGVR
jgi:Flp pilus assembly protein TadD